MRQCDFIRNLAAIKRTYLTGNNIWINRIHLRLTTPENQTLSITEFIQFTIKNWAYTNVRNLSNLCGKVISTWFVVANIAQLNVKSKEHTQNHSSGVQANETNASDYMKTTRLCRKSLFGEIISYDSVHVFLHPYQVPTVFIYLDTIIT